MLDVSTQFMGIKLKNPIIAGASGLTGTLDSIKKLEDAGVGAIVFKSLLEEEIQLERLKMDEDEVKYDNRSPEITSVYPHNEHAGPKNHLMLVRKAKESLDIPLIASVNAETPQSFIEYARLLEQTGVDGIELNLYDSPKRFSDTAASLEEFQIALLKSIRESIKIPVSVKLSSTYTNPLNFIHRIDSVGSFGFVLFNRYFQPEIDVVQKKHIFPFNLSSPADHRMALRYVGLLSGTVNGNVCASTGIFDAHDVIKMILSGAAAVQIVSTLYKNGSSVVGKILEELQGWMSENNYTKLDDFRAILNAKNSSDPWAYTRAQYAHLLMNPQKIVNNFPAPL